MNIVDVEIKTLKAYIDNPPSWCCTCYWFSSTDCKDPYDDIYTCLYDGEADVKTRYDKHCDATTFLKRLMERV